MSERYKIAIVEDDPEIGPMTCAVLQRDGFDAALATNGAALDALLASQHIDLIVLDIMLPGEDGLSICRRVSPDVPVILLTARADDLDRIIGLELGADDYLGKPFNPRELVARIRAVLRRTDSSRAPALGRMVVEELEFDFERLSATRHGRALTLTSGEFGLMRAFLSNPGKILSRDALMDAAHRRKSDPLDRTIDVQISRLRAKIGDRDKPPRLIRTVRNAGYVFVGEIQANTP